MPENRDQITATLKNVRLFLRGAESQLDMLERLMRDPDAMLDRIEREKQAIYVNMTETLERLQRLEDANRSSGR